MQFPYLLVSFLTNSWSRRPVLSCPSISPRLPTQRSWTSDMGPYRESAHTRYTCRGCSRWRHCQPKRRSASPFIKTVPLSHRGTTFPGQISKAVRGLRPEKCLTGVSHETPGAAGRLPAIVPHSVASSSAHLVILQKITARHRRCRDLFSLFCPVWHIS